jgi:hypothetical protein
MTVLNLLCLFAITGLAVYVVLFIAGVRRKKQGWSVLVVSYIRHLFGGAGVALAVAVVLVFTLTAYYNSPSRSVSTDRSRAGGRICWRFGGGVPVAYQVTRSLTVAAAGKLDRTEAGYWIIVRL